MDTCKWFITFLSTIFVSFVEIRAIGATGDDLLDNVFESLTPLTKTLSDAKSEYNDKYMDRLHPKINNIQYDTSFPWTNKAKREIGNTKKTVIPLYLSLGPNKHKHYTIPNVAAAKESTNSAVPLFVTPKQSRALSMALKPSVFSKDTEDLQKKEFIKEKPKQVSKKDEVYKVNHDSRDNVRFRDLLNTNELLPNISSYNPDFSFPNVQPLDKNTILNCLYKKGIKSSKVPYFEESFKPKNKESDPIKTMTQKTLALTQHEVNEEQREVPHDDFENTKHLVSEKPEENKSNHTMVPDKTNNTFDASPTVRSMTLETRPIPLILNNKINLLSPQVASAHPASDMNENGPDNSLVIENRTAEEFCVPPSTPDNIIQKPYIGSRSNDAYPYNQLRSAVASYPGYPRIYNGEVTNTQNIDYYNLLNALRYQRYLSNYIDVSNILPREDQGSLLDHTLTNTRIFLPNSPIEQTIEINIKKGDKKIHSVEILPACNQNTRPIIAYSNGYYDNQNTQPLSYF